MGTRACCVERSVDDYARGRLSRSQERVAQLAAGLTCVTSARTILSLSFLFHFALAFASRSRA